MFHLLYILCLKKQEDLLYFMKWCFKNEAKCISFYFLNHIKDQNADYAGKHSHSARISMNARNWAACLISWSERNLT